MGIDLLIIDMFDSINNFKNKLIGMKNQLSEANYSSLPFCSQTIEKYGIIFESDKVVQIIDNLILEFDNRFIDFNNYSDYFKIFQNPFSVDINKMPENFYNILENIQMNPDLISNFRSMKITEFKSSTINHQVYQMKV